MGRRKIAIEPLTDDRNRTVTFVKRKAGLFKKAHELAVLCQVDLAVIIVGNNNKIYEFSSVDTQDLISRYGRAKPYESKSPENYGNYKKKSRLRDAQSHFSPKEEILDVPVDDVDSDYDSDSPEPKRAKIAAAANPPPEQYPAGPSAGTQLASYGENSSSGTKSLQQHQQHQQTPQHQHTQPVAPVQHQTQHQRPVLRVQIPSDAKNSSSNDSAKTITAVDTRDQKKTTPSDGDSGGNPHHSRFDSFPKFRGTPQKNTPQLPVPTISKSQTSSPSSAVAPQLPRNSGVPFFASLPQASPGGYQTAILPTPVLNQVFNQQYMGQPSALPQTEPGEAAEGGGNSQNGHGENDDAHKYKPTFPGQFANPEQTPVSALPSRYVNDIFPSPSNLYPTQDWPQGMTSFPSNVPHFFVGMMPSGSGTAPISGNPMFMNTRGSLSSAIGSGPGAGAGNSGGSAGQRGQEDASSSTQNSQAQLTQQSTSTSPQHSDIYMTSQFNYKK